MILFINGSLVVPRSDDYQVWVKSCLECKLDKLTLLIPFLLNLLDKPIALM